MGWALIFALWGYGNPQPALTSQAFETKELCIAAGQAAAESVRFDRFETRAKWTCVKIRH